MDVAALGDACELSTSCPDAIKVLAAQSKSSVPRDEVRDDVTIAWQGNPEFLPAAFSTSTSRLFTYSGSGRVVLTGSPDGTAPFHVDDFLLVEVLAPNGARLASGVVNSTAVQLEAQPALVLAPMSAWGGLAQGWSYNQVDISSLLPKNQPFRLRVGAYDVTSVALVSDVYLKAVAAAPPPPSTDPFDAASCAGPAMTKEQARTRFVPGTTETDPLGTFELFVRQRTCSTLTGCTAWSRDPGASQFRVGHNGSVKPTTNTGLVKIHATGGDFRMTFVNAPTSNGYDYRIGHYVAGGAAQFWQDEQRRQYDVLLGDTSWNSYGAGFPATVTNDCARMAWSGRHQTGDGSVAVELEAVLLGRFTR